jgi:hypothetical protein
MNRCARIWSVNGRVRLTRLAASIAGQGLEATAQAVWSALQHEVLAQQVRDYDADLVVVSLPAAGRRAVRKLWHCVAASPASVLVVRGDAIKPTAA